LIQIVEGHQVAITSKDVHFAIKDGDGLTITSTRLFADNESVTIIIDYLLF